MSNKPVFRSGRSRPDPVPRLLAAAALTVSIIALVAAMGGLAPAEKAPTQPKNASAKQTKERKTEAKKRTAALNKRFSALGERFSKVTANCPISGAIDMGTWCLEGSTYKVPTSDIGKNDYFYATQKCVAEGGWLPTAAQLIGAAPEIALKSTADDDPGTSGASETPEASVGIKDEREMSSDLFTTGSGARAAGFEGVSEKARGVGNTGEPNPVPLPAEPAPETLDYITVYDNHNLGGFAGGEPITKTENFRCAYAKGYQGKPRNTSSRS